MMTSPQTAVVNMTSKKEETHQRILQSIHKGFRQQGYDGAGVDGLATAAGVTSGAFYSHFGSKAQAFRETVAEGVLQFAEAVEHYQEEYGDNWLEEFSSFYLGEKRNCTLSESCALQSLTSEVARSDKKTRSVFQSELLKAEKTFSTGMKNTNKPDPDYAWSTIAMLIGGVTLARAVKDQTLADEIAQAILNVVKDNNSNNMPAK